MDIGDVVISPSASIMIPLEDTLKLNCSVDVSADTATSQDMRDLGFEWTLNNRSLTFPEVTISYVQMSGNTYSSSLEVTNVQEFNSGEYTCAVVGHRRLSASTLVSTCNIFVLIY